MVFQDLGALVNNRNPRYSFPELFSLNFVKYNPNRVASLQLSLQEHDDNSLSNMIENNKIMKKISWPAFENFLLKYLICIRDLDPWSVINSIDFMIAVFESQSMILNPKNEMHDRICKLTLPHYKESMALIIPLCTLIDVESMHIHNRTSDYQRLTHISTILLKSLNNIRSTPDLNDVSNIDKISLLFEISTNLCHVYYKIGSPILCSNVFSNVNILSLNKRFIPMSSLLKFRFVMGKYYAHQSNFMSAYHHLNSVYRSLQLETCPIRNVVVLLKYLIPVGLIVGKVTNIDKIRQLLMNNMAASETDFMKLETLFKLYEPLMQHFKSGNFYEFYKCICDNESYWKSIGLWIPMLQRLRVPILRNLFLQTWKINMETLSFATAKIALLESMKGMETLRAPYQIKNELNEPIDDVFIDNVFSSLVYNGYLKMKMTADRTIVLSKKDTFPDIFLTIVGRFPKNPKESWMDE